MHWELAVSLKKQQQEQFKDKTEHFKVWFPEGAPILLSKSSSIHSYF